VFLSYLKKTCKDGQKEKKFNVVGEALDHLECRASHLENHLFWYSVNHLLKNLDQEHLLEVKLPCARLPLFTQNSKDEHVYFCFT